MHENLDTFLQKIYKDSKRYVCKSIENFVYNYEIHCINLEDYSFSSFLFRYFIKQ